MLQYVCLLIAWGTHHIILFNVAAVDLAEWKICGWCSFKMCRRAGFWTQPGKRAAQRKFKAHDTKAAELGMSRASPTTSNKVVSSRGSQEGFRNKSTSLGY